MATRVIHASTLSNFFSTGMAKKTLVLYLALLKQLVSAASGKL